MLLDQADAGRVLCLAFLGVPFPRDYTITHTNPGWTSKILSENFSTVLASDANHEKLKRLFDEFLAIAA